MQCNIAVQYLDGVLSGRKMISSSGICFPAGEDTPESWKAKRPLAARPEALSTWAGGLESPGPRPPGGAASAERFKG